MPVQISDTTTLINFSAPDETLIIAPGVQAGGGIVGAFTGAVLYNYGNVLRTTIEGAVAINHSEIYNAPGALIVGFEGIRYALDRHILRNEGTIQGFGEHGVLANAAANHITIENSGTIRGPISGIAISSGSAQSVSITNSGTISSDERGIWLLNVTGAAPTIVNTGTISGRLHAIIAESGDRLDVTNSGALVGDVTGLSDGQSDSVINAGTISGNVRLGTGSDLYSGTGVVSGTVFGEDGNDSLSGGASLDRLSGGLGNDTLSGNTGSDLLDGGDGDDSIFGGAGSDALTGGIGQDTLRGDDGNDVVTAGDGSDHLGGGRGIDRLTGGAGVDFFVFDTAPNGLTNRDIVTDFRPADDTFQFARGAFPKLGTHSGGLNPAFFFAGKAAHDADDHIIYDRPHGNLFYDSNGNLPGGSVLIATLSNHAALAANDFKVF
jgi:Ca2+-binding RTX toxin-like protein